MQLGAILTLALNNTGDIQPASTETIRAEFGKFVPALKKTCNSSALKTQLQMSVQSVFPRLWISTDGQVEGK